MYEDSNKDKHVLLRGRTVDGYYYLKVKIKSYRVMSSINIQTRSLEQLIFLSCKRPSEIRIKPFLSHNLFEPFHWFIFG